MDPECAERSVDSASVTAPRRLRAHWSTEQADNLRQLWGPESDWITRPVSVVDRIGAMGRGEPDPGEWFVPEALKFAVAAVRSDEDEVR